MDCRDKPGNDSSGGWIGSRAPARGEGVPAHARVAARTAPRGQGGLTMPGPRVLFVDDEAPLRHAVPQGLELCGHEVTCFATARLAEAQLSRTLYVVPVSAIKMQNGTAS